MADAYIGLGANLGDRPRTMRRAVARLAALGTVTASSPLFETDPVGFADQPAFLNAVIRLQTDRAPGALVADLLGIEREFGRERTFLNAPRRLDLDLLFYGGLVSNDPAAIVPHPRLHQRRFVLVPLATIAPELVHPVFGETVAHLLAALADDGGVRPFEPNLAASPPRPGNDSGG